MEERDANLDMGMTLALDIINRLIKEYNFHVRNIITQQQLVSKVGRMLVHGVKILDVAIIKFIKSLLVSKFKPYITDLMKEDYLPYLGLVIDRAAAKRSLL